MAGQGVVVDPDELSAAASSRRLARFLARPPDRALQLVASLDGELIGTIDIDCFERRRLAHVGILTLGVHPSHQGCGIGRLLMEAALAWADAVGVLRVELYTRCDNIRAQRLYESVGFTAEGVRRCFVRDPDGRLVDDVVMGRLREQL